MITFDAVLDRLEQQINQFLPRQVTDPTRSDYGAYISEAYGIAEPAGMVSLIVACGWLWLHRRNEDWLTRARLGMQYLLRAQRPDGLIDLISCNYDSAPDTAFAVQRLCPLLEVGRGHGGEDWAGFLALVEAFVRRAVSGMLTGGFHTPNHRWVIASALAWAAHLYPDLDVSATVEAYLAEGLDIDAEGAFIERSVGVYDAVCDRSLLLLHTFWHAPGALDAVVSNLNFDLHLLHADGTAETALSRRQDAGTRIVPLSLAAPLLWTAHLTGEARFATAAQFLWQQVTTPGVDELNWLAYVLFKWGPFEVADNVLPERWARFWPLNGLWRMRDGPLSVTVLRGSTRLLSLIYGRAELCRLSIAQSYFGVGQFFTDSMEVEGDTVVLRSEGRQRSHRPGYDLPLGRPVPPHLWNELRLQGDYRPFPPCTGELRMRPVRGGLELRYRTLDGMPGVTAQIALDLAPGGVWETGDTCLSTHAGQVIFLKKGYGTMLYGVDALRIGPGAHAHRTWQMRDVEPAPACVRVLMTFLTPVDWTFTITCDTELLKVSQDL